MSSVGPQAVRQNSFSLGRCVVPAESAAANFEAAARKALSGLQKTHQHIFLQQVLHFCLIAAFVFSHFPLLQRRCRQTRFHRIVLQLGAASAALTFHYLHNASIHQVRVPQVERSAAAASRQQDNDEGQEGSWRARRLFAANSAHVSEIRRDFRRGGRDFAPVEFRVDICL